MKKLLLVMLLITSIVNAQTPDECKEELSEIKAFTAQIDKSKLTNLTSSGDMFTKRGMRLIVNELRQQVSGVTAKDGKSKGLNGTIDDKGINFNGTFSNKENNLFGLIVSATSKDKFVDLFSSNQLKNIYSIGGNYKLFLMTTANYDVKDKTKLFTDLLKITSDGSLDDREKVKQTDNLQKSAKVGKSILWLNINAKYNNNPVKIVDINKKDYTSSYNNEFLSTDLSFNLLRKTKNNLNLYFSPTLSFSNSRKFNADDIKNVNIITPITLGTSSAQEIKSITYYEKVENRVYTAALDIPLVLFFPNQKFGLDVAFKAGVNDPDNNNVSARLGAYIPFYLSDKKESMTIEPILKFNKLFGSSSNNFIEDNLVIGFNISVTVPEFLN